MPRLLAQSRNDTVFCGVWCINCELSTNTTGGQPSPPLCGPPRPGRGICPQHPLEHGGNFKKIFPGGHCPPGTPMCFSAIVDCRKAGGETPPTFNCHITLLNQLILNSLLRVPVCRGHVHFVPIVRKLTSGNFCSRKNWSIRCQTPQTTRAGRRSRSTRSSHSKSHSCTRNRPLSRGRWRRPTKRPTKAKIVHIMYHYHLPTNLSLGTSNTSFLMYYFLNRHMWKMTTLYSTDYYWWFRSCHCNSHCRTMNL